MKLLKKIAIIILVVFGLYILVSLFLPSLIRIERSIVINSKSALVYEQINNLKNWKHWSYWDNIDKNMISNYSGPESGVGAKHCWESKNDSVGKGCLTISEEKENSLVVTTLEFEGMGSSIGGWRINDTTNGVNVTTYMELDMGLFGRIFPGLMMDSWLGSDFEKSLTNLKAHCEKLALTSSETPEIKIELTTTSAQLLATYKMSSSLQTISDDIGTSYGKIIEFMQKNKLAQTASVLAFYHSFSPEKIDLECAIPVDKTAKSANDVNVVEFPSTNAVVAHYYGAYTGTGAAHEAIDKWLKEKKLSITGSPWEVYVTDPMMEKDTSKWLTDIYYPVK
ncbi:MAG: SRPBCC family protein [Bacteroidetes bacterium]|nr:SRPBCC family protein [Bacteroidota bacterium]